MSYRPERLSHVVRGVVSDAIANRIWDPRVSHFTSVTRVELSGDLRFADVYVSVMGTDAEAQKTMKGLDSARGMIQTRLARSVDMRQCPLLRFHLDTGLKTAIETHRLLDEVKAGLAAAPSAEAADVPDTADAAEDEMEDDEKAADRP